MGNKYNEVKVKEHAREEEVQEAELVGEKKDLNKVVSATPKKVKKGLLSRLVSGVVGPDGAPSIGAYVNNEIIVPAFKNIVVDAVTSGINMLMYGESRGRGGANYGYRPGPPTTYNRPSTNYNNHYQGAPQQYDDRRVARPNFNGLPEFLIEDRYDAAQVLTAMTEHADMYGTVSIADYYDLIGVESTKYTDNNYGWSLEGISRATIVPTRGGFIIRFPQVEAI